MLRLQGIYFISQFENKAKTTQAKGNDKEETSSLSPPERRSLSSTVQCLLSAF
jgi:hypothetical protein